MNPQQNYVQGRRIHDADSHIMELPTAINPYIESAFKARFDEWHYQHKGSGTVAGKEEAWRLQQDEQYKEKTLQELMLHKNSYAHGAYIQSDRIAALNALGVASQLVFPTYCLGNFGLDQSGQHDLCYAAADAQNRMMVDFCSVDKRMLPVAYLPLVDFDLAQRTAKLAIELGAKALMIPSACPQKHSPSHTGLFPVWEMALAASIPIVFHVGGQDDMNLSYNNNGLAPVKDFQGGDDNFTSLRYMSIPYSVMQTLAALIFDGIFDKFPQLKWSCIELGAEWLPGLLKSLDSCAHAFRKNEDRLQLLSALPSEIAARQLRVAPYPHEDAGWIMRNTHSDILMFSTDFPHAEGGRNPLKRFDQSLTGETEQNIRKFYEYNFEDMMGASLDSTL